jgi:hypothetical protein
MSSQLLKIPKSRAAFMRAGDKQKVQTLTHKTPKADFCFHFIGEDSLAFFASSTLFAFAFCILLFVTQADVACACEIHTKIQ